jgi:hypothetical protein
LALGYSGQAFRLGDEAMAIAERAAGTARGCCTASLPVRQANGFSNDHVEGNLRLAGKGVIGAEAYLRARWSCHRRKTRAHELQAVTDLARL